MTSRGGIQRVELDHAGHHCPVFSFRKHRLITLGYSNLAGQDTDSHGELVPTPMCRLIVECDAGARKSQV